MSDKPKIGFCWRSSVTSTIRNHNYTVLEQWNELLTSSEFSFVNLQYDLDHEQLITQYPEVEELFLDTGHLDQRDDLEGTISNFKFGFCYKSAATPGMMASASEGVPTLIYHKPGFWNFGRIGKFVQNPFFKLTRNYHSDDISTDKNLVSDISNFLMVNKNNFPRNVIMRQQKVGVVDYGMGNTKSVLNAIRIAGGEAKIVSNPEDLLSFDKLILR